MASESGLAAALAVGWVAILSAACLALCALRSADEVQTLSGEGPIPVRPGSVSTGIDPMRRGLASLEGPPSLLSQRPKRSVGTLQGLTCD